MSENACRDQRCFFFLFVFFLCFEAQTFEQFVSELFTSFNGTSELYIECVYIRKHCNTTVYLVLDQAANITFFFLKKSSLWWYRPLFLVLKCIVCTKYPVKLNSWLYYIATYIFMYCDFYFLEMSFWQTCLCYQRPHPPPPRPTPFSLCDGKDGIEFWKKEEKKKEKKGGPGVGGGVTQQR